MKNLLSSKAYGVGFVIASFVMAVVSLVRYLIWASAHNTMDISIVVVLVVGIVSMIATLLKDEDMLVVVAAGCVSYATFKHLANQVGSFVDAFQGINMFGDATQVGNIVSIAICMGICIILTVVSGFVKREK